MTTEEDILAQFRFAADTPAAWTSGNILADDLNRIATRYMERDRLSLIEAVEEWLESRDDLLTVQAIILVQEFKLVELTDATQRIRDEVAEGAFLDPSQVWRFDRALQTLRGHDGGARTHSPIG